MSHERDDHDEGNGTAMSSRSAPDVTTHVGTHLHDRREDALLRICRQTMADASGLHHLAYYTDRVLDFALDNLDADEVSLPQTRDRSRAGLRRLGRQLCAAFEQLDQELRPASTGALIRAVIRTDDAEIVCDPIVQTQYVVGVGYTGNRNDYIDDTNDVDRSLAILITRLRAEVGLSSQNLGGFETETAAPPALAPTPPHVSTRAPIPDAVKHACAAALHPADLHFVAYCVDDEVVHVADVFDHAGLGMYFAGTVTPQYRRDYYRSFCDRLGEIRAQLNRVTALLLRGRLKRVVLDVEQGAVYYFRVAGRVHLVGVTLHQPRVRSADERMRELAIECQRHPSV